MLILVAIGGASLAFDVPGACCGARRPRSGHPGGAWLTGAHKAEALAAAPGQRPVTRRPEPARAPSAAGGGRGLRLPRSPPPQRRRHRRHAGEPAAGACLRWTSWRHPPAGRRRRYDAPAAQ